MPAPQQPTQLIRVPAVLDKTREEIKGLVSLCEMDIPQEEKAKRLDSLHEDWFSIDAVRNIFKRIRASRSLSGQVPGFHSIANDTTLPPESQNIARAVVSAGAAYQFNTADWDSFTRMLRNNFTMTQYVRMHHEIGDQLRAMDPNLIGTIESTLLQYQASISKHVAQRKLPVRLGAGATDNSALLSRILNPNRSESFIKTGFPEFDRRTGGFKYGQVLLTMSRFGGGKSALALSMGINMAKGGKRGAYISFELGEDELFERFITNVSGVDGNNIRIGGDQLSDSDRARIEARYAEFNTGEGSLSLICPNTLSAGGWDINDTLKVIEGCGYDFVIFDYLGLIQYHKLEGISSAREDQILSDMARKIKIH
jgi:replicative DNA helicase